MISADDLRFLFAGTAGTAAFFIFCWGVLIFFKGIAVPFTFQLCSAQRLAKAIDSEYYHLDRVTESTIETTMQRIETAMQRPAAIHNPATGLLRAEQFQIAYATNDIELARKLFAQRYGIKVFRRLEGQLPVGGHIHIELAWVGSTMYELLTATGPGSELYIGRLPTDEFAIRHHHLGFLIHTDDEWNALFTGIEDNGWKLLSKSSNPGFMQSCFVDAPELGHYLEYLFPEPAGLAFFESVPGN